MRSSRHKFLGSALDDVDAAPAGSAEILILPPDDGDRNIPSDEEDELEEIENDTFPKDVPGELEVLINIDEDTSEFDDPLACSTRWRKKDNLNMKKHTIKPLPSEIFELNGLSVFDIFQKYFTPEMISYVTEQTRLYANRDKNDQSFYITDEEIPKF